MKVTNEIDLKNFEFWSGGLDHYNMLTDEELDTIQFILEDLYPDGIDEVELNDLFWFDFDWLADLINTTEDELYERYMKVELYVQANQ